MELEINKAKTEEATLKDALLKMQAMNEGLGQDKVELNKIIMQVTTHTPPSQILTGLILRRQCVCREREIITCMNDGKLLDESTELVLYQEISVYVHVQSKISMQEWKNINFL